MSPVIRFFIALFLCLAEYLAFSQDLVHNWANSPKGKQLISSGIKIWDQKSDGSSFYLLGSYSGQVDFDFGPDEFILNSGKFEQRFLAKYDTDYNLVWAYGFAGGDDESTNELAVKSNLDLPTDIVIITKAKGLVDLDPTKNQEFVNYGNQSRLLYSRFNGNGEFHGHSVLAINNEATVKSLMIDRNSYVYYGVNFTDTLSFNKGSGTELFTSRGLSDMLVVKSDLVGDANYVVHGGGSGKDEIWDVLSDENDLVYITGSFSDTLELPASTGTHKIGSQGGEDAFFALINALGTANFVKGIGGEGTQCGKRLLLKQDSLYVVGEYQGATDFDPSEDIDIKEGLVQNLFLSKFKKLGSYQSTVTIQGSETLSFVDAVLDIDGQIITTGTFRANLNYELSGVNSSLSSNGFSDVFLFGLSSSLQVNWAKQLGTSANDYTNGLVSFKDSCVGVYGEFARPLDFDLSSTNSFTLDPNNYEKAFLSNYSTKNLNFKDAKMLGSDNEFSGNLSPGNIEVDRDGYVIEIFTHLRDWYLVDADSNSLVQSYDNVNASLIKYDKQGNEVFILRNNLKGNNSRVEARHCGFDSVGNIYVAGFFNGEVDFVAKDSTVEKSIGITRSLYLAKYSPEGNLVWFKEFGNMGGKRVSGFAVTPAGNTYLVAQISTETSLNPDNPSDKIAPDGVHKVVLASYNNQGNLLWARLVKGLPGNFQFMDLACDSRENLYLAGNLLPGTHDLNSHTTTPLLVGQGPNEQSVIAKFNNNGTAEWAKTISGDIGFLARVKLTSADQVIVQMPLQEDLTLVEDAITINADGKQGLNSPFAFIKLDSLGTIMYTRKLGAYTLGNFGYVHFDFEIGENDELLITDEFRDDFDFHPHPDSTWLRSSDFGSSNVYLLKVDSSGTPTDLFTMGSPGDDLAYRLKYYQNNILLQGGYGHEIDVDFESSTCLLTNHPNTPFQGHFLASYSFCEINSVQVNALYRICSGDDVDIVIPESQEGVEYSLKNLFGEPVHNSLIGNGDTLKFVLSTITSNQVLFLIASTANCEKILTRLVVQLNNAAPLEIALNGDSLVVDFYPDYTYQWLDCENNMEEIDLAQSHFYKPATEGSYALVYSNGLCSDTTDCFAYSPSSIAGNHEISFALVPNPTKDKVSIRLAQPFNKELNLTLKDQKGRILLEQQFTSNQKQIEIKLNDIASGVYFLAISTGERLAVRKLVVY